jgi:hypothetical protein
VAGIEATREIFAADASAAVAAAEQIGYPVVMKAVARALVHKSDIGAVKLALANPEDIPRCLARHNERSSQSLAESEMAGCLVQEMASEGVEIILGAKWDPQFGACRHGRHGRRFRRDHGRMSHSRSRRSRALGRARCSNRYACGRSSWVHADARQCDVDALVDALQRVSGIAHALGPQLLELDVNPLLVRQHGVIALDARATLAAPISDVEAPVSYDPLISASPGVGLDHVRSYWSATAGEAAADDGRLTGTIDTRGRDNRCGLYGSVVRVSPCARLRLAGDR